MNWGLIAWVAGTLATIYGIKFVFMAVRTLLSKDTMESALEVVGNSVKASNKKFKKYLKQKVEKQRKQNAENNKPVVTIR